MATFVSVDLDDLACYHAIHGLDAPETAEAHAVVLERCLPRFLELFAAADVHATFFVIGRDLERDLATGGKGAALLRQARKAGHELANHSYAHDYRMVTWSAVEMARDLGACDRLLRELGETPVGFRAPGYTHDRTLLAQVAAQGYRYDSSSLPAPLYYAAKRGVMTWMRLRGRASASHDGGAASFFGPTHPYFMSELGLWEVPMSVSRFARLPLIGTTLLAGPDALSARLRNEAAARSSLVLELHGLDLADPETDGLARELVSKEPVLAVPLETRRERLRTLLVARGGGGTIRGGLTRG